ncbi:MAG: DUF2752 domain-containing protein [Bacteroidaceae bacterium]|nr:DUF2752 domain-containing protein [Bacteroidaceae bacterium]
MLPCPFHFLTGLDCPFCGAQRMVLALLHGQVSEAFWLNPGLAVGAPLVGAWWWWKGEISSRVAFVLLCLAIVWGILRNIVNFGPSA